jgi:hypothetical protein
MTQAANDDQKPDDKTNQQPNPADNKPAGTPDVLPGDQIDEQKPGLGDQQVLPDKKDEGTEIKFEPTGDAGLDLTLGFLGRLGFDIDHPAMQAAGAGDFGLLKAELALLGDKARGWEQVIAVGEAAYTKKNEAFKAKAAADAASMAEAAGGVDQWNKVKEWAGKNAEPEERVQINAALKQGGMVGQAMAAFLAGQWAKAADVTDRGRSAVKDGAGAAVVSNSSLSPADYAKGINELKKQYGNQFTNTTEYQELQARRRAWRG